MTNERDAALEAAKAAFDSASLTPGANPLRAAIRAYEQHTNTWIPFEKFEELWEGEEAPERFLALLDDDRIEICIDNTSFDYEEVLEVLIEHTRERVYPTAYRPLPSPPQKVT